VQAGLLEPGQKITNKGYVTHMGASTPGAANLKVQTPELDLTEVVPGFTKSRLENADTALPLDEAVTAYRQAGSEANY
jgi:hypothetical protein